jgi:hypothetical protein
MKTSILKKIYFQNIDDKDLNGFVIRFLSSGLLWIYIALNPRKQWKLVYDRLNKKQQQIFVNEYNKAFLFSCSYKELTKLFLGKKITLKNLFLPHFAETSPEGFIKFNLSDDRKWKEVLELVS